ncbi:MAG: hypothetical protein P1U67_08635 [Alcanivoracaceae bacterium]|nr:hypothetical protein [Alcanivoracaceae bacterium]
MSRSAALILLLWCVTPFVQAAELCAFPGRDSDRQLKGVVNRWIPSPDNTVLEPGTRAITVAEGWRGRGAVQSGDLLLLVQMQGAVIDHGNDDAYGDGTAGDGIGRGLQALQAGYFEYLRVEQLSGVSLQVRGAGPNGGVLHRYISRSASKAGLQGAARWQLVRIPQFENLTLTDDLETLPWDGRSGGLLALDVRRELRLNGHTINAQGAGFRGGAALTLGGALGDELDFRYRAPAVDELRVRFGQHASKGEGMAGTPRWVVTGQQESPVEDSLPQADKLSHSDGYPEGSMAKGAPANAGGGGVSLSADNSMASGGGGGAGGTDGQAGFDVAGERRGGFGGAAIDVDEFVVTAGGGGGAGTRSQGKGGNGGAGGGIVMIRTGIFNGPGVINIAGAEGESGDQAGGGGGGAGTLWLQAPFGRVDKLKLNVTGGSGGQGPALGGSGGDGRILYGGGLSIAGLTSRPVNGRLQRDSAAGVAAGFICRPSGMLLGGTLFEDNGADVAGSDDAVAHDGRRQRLEKGLAGWPVRVLTADGNEIATTKTSENGQFALELPEQWAGKPLRLSAPIKKGWHAVVAQSNDLPLAPFRYTGNGEWLFTGQKEYLQDGLVLGLIREPELEVPAQRTAKKGSTQVFLFRYIPHTDSRARFHYRGELSGSAGWKHAFFLDPDCDNASDYVEKNSTSWVPVQAEQPVCVRVRVDVPADSDMTSALKMRIEVESDLGNTPLGLTLKPAQADIVISPAL